MTTNREPMDDSVFKGLIDEVWKSSGTKCNLTIKADKGLAHWVDGPRYTHGPGKTVPAPDPKLNKLLLLL